MLTNQPIL